MGNNNSTNITTITVVNSNFVSIIVNNFGGPQKSPNQPDSDYIVGFMKSQFQSINGYQFGKAPNAHYNNYEVTNPVYNNSFDANFQGFGMNDDFVISIFNIVADFGCDEKSIVTEVNNEARSMINSAVNSGYAIANWSQPVVMKDEGVVIHLVVTAMIVKNTDNTLCAAMIAEVYSSKLLTNTHLGQVKFLPISRRIINSGDTENKMINIVNKTKDSIFVNKNVVESGKKIEVAPGAVHIGIISKGVLVENNRTILSDFTYRGE